MNADFRQLPRLLLILGLSFSASTAHAEIFQWEHIDPADPSQGKRQSATLAPDGAGIDAVPGAVLEGLNLQMAYLFGADLTDANLTSAGLNNAYLFGAKLTGADFTGAEVRGAFLQRSGITPAQIYSTASYAARDLGSIDLSDSDLRNANFSGHNLTGAAFGGTNLAGADISQANLSGARFHALSGGCDATCHFNGANLSGANLRQANLTNVSFFTANLSGADITGAIVRGDLNEFSSAQLYSTASYQAGDLRGSYLSGFYSGAVRFSGWNFANQNLTNSYFEWLLLDGVDFTGADLRGATFAFADLSRASSNNHIGTNGHINGLELDSGQVLIVRDYDGDVSQGITAIAITVEQQFTMEAGGALRAVFDTDAWDSTISFAPGIPVTLGGTLDLTFAADVNLATQVGRTFDLFDWIGVNPIGTFAVSSPYTWDLSNLYTTGDVTLIAAPEPASVALMWVGIVSLRRHRRRLH